jgi:hypothetical protein
MAQSKIGWRSYISPIQYTLDKYGSSAAAYSLRKLKVSYSGFAIRVRRSSDNTEQNIGFNTSNDLDTTTLTAFVGSGHGFVTTWYDQSGNNKNATQTTAANQPYIVVSGTLQTLNGKPSLFFNGESKYLDCGYLNGGTKPANFSTFISANFTAVNQTRTIFSSMDAGGNGKDTYNTFGIHSAIAYQMFGGAGGGIYYKYWRTSNVPTQSLPYLFEQHYKSNISPFIGTFYWNNTAQSTTEWLQGSSTISGGPEFKTSIGRSGENNGGYHQGFVQEIATYFSDQMSNRSGIVSDINSYYSIWDNDAEAFITAANLSAGQGSSIRTLVATLKTAGIWSKLKAIYPFVGGSANSHKYNLKDPRDLDEAYRLNFYGGWTHNVSGPYGNGSNSYADTNLNPFLKLNTNSSSIGVWVPNGMNNHGFGVWSNSGANKFSIIEQGGGYLKSQMTSSSTEAWGITNTTSGFIMGNRTSATSNKIYRFGSLFTVHPTYGGVPHNTTANTADYPNANFWLGRVNGNTSISYYNQSIYFAYIADGLTDAEILALSNAAYTFRQSIGHY